MSDWLFLNQHRVTVPSPRIMSKYISSDADGFNGMFRFMLDSKFIRCVASDGEDWQHVSVSIENETKPPNWAIMCKVKELFWEPEDVAVQFHPARSQYVNFHPGCLHIWRYTGTEFRQPIPHWFLVGPKAICR